MALDHDGILIPIFRQVHVHITGTTRKTFFEQVLPSELRGRPDLVRIRQSGGQDFIELWNKSQIHFAGLDSDTKVFSAEYGAAFFDEAHEISEQDILTVNTRLRQRCPDCIQSSNRDCDHYPHTIALAFNPSFPGHFLHSWFLVGGTHTEWGRRKDELFATDATDSIGSCEFFKSLASDNPFLPTNYVGRNLAGLSPRQRRRFLDGFWEHGSGSFFDSDALSDASDAASEYKPLLIGEPQGDLTGQDPKDPPTIRERSRDGRLEVFKKPVRQGTAKNGDEIKAHRYVVSVDASSGVSSDYSAVQVIDVEELEQVAEWQGKVDPDKLAEVAFLLACVYNGAILAPEITGGWGFAVVKRCQAMTGAWKGKPQWRPQLYTRPVVDRISQKWTDLLGWDTTTKSRAQMLDVLEQSLRDQSVTIHGPRTLAEMFAFAIPERIGSVGDYRSPRAQKGSHDDLVIALAIGVAVAVRLPKKTTLAPRTLYGMSWDEDLSTSATGW